VGAAAVGLVDAQARASGVHPEGQRKAASTRDSSDRRLDITLLRPARHGEPDQPDARYFKPLRQIIESINDTLKGQLDLEHHGGRTTTGVLVRIWQRLLALTAVIWHNDHIGQTIKRSLIAYDH
jgi:hypothetical protein